jgi:asparagine synthase (glutamine-hydrolysing)
MCGIFGIVHRDATLVPEREKLDQSAQLLGHRGPDSRGVHVEPGLGLVHTRLALVDLSERGRQPFWDPEQRFCLVYNGEIYNFRELRAELAARGVVFHTSSDTEVLLHALILDGPERTLPRLQGMFAFAFYDRRERQLLLARDRFGIKPLAVCRDGDFFAFASEIKAFAPWKSPRANPWPICAYLLGAGGQPTQGACFYQGVELLPPGSLVRVRLGGEPRCERFFELADFVDAGLAEELARRSRAELVDELDERLSRSVRQMMFADARVGAFCSGGVDSSLVMAMAAREHDDLAIFHAHVKGPHSEYDAALRLSQHLGLELRAVDVLDRDFVDLVPDVIRHYEHPFGYHPNSVPFLMVSRLVRESGVTGVLSGEGSDECFLGYEFLAQEPFEQAWERTRARLRRLVWALPRLGRRLWPRAEPCPGVVAGMLGGFERELDAESVRGRWRAVRGDRDLRSARSLDLLGYHLRTLLHRNDCLGMAASIEARFPYLDERVVELAVNLPYRAKIRFSAASRDPSHPLLSVKWILREVADRYVPRELSQRKKLGFLVSAFDRMRVPPEYFRASFLAEFFELAAAQLQHLLANADQELLVRLLLLDVWGRMCLGGEDASRVRARLREHVSIA